MNPSYHAFAEHYQVAILPARAKKPRDKSKVEKAVQEVERQIIAPLRHQRFTSFADLNAAIRERLERLNHRVMKSYGCSRRTLFEQVDQPALQPLPHPALCLCPLETSQSEPGLSPGGRQALLLGALLVCPARGQRQNQRTPGGGLL